MVDTATGDNSITTAPPTVEQITGTAGSTICVAGVGGDTLNGGDGNDWLTGGLSADTLNGGNNIDTADYRNSDASVTVNLSDALAETGGHARAIRSQASKMSSARTSQVSVTT